MEENQNQNQNPEQALQASNGNAVQTTFNFFDPNQFATMQRYCRMYASSDLVPDSYKITSQESEAKAIGNCMIAMDIALRIGASPLMVMQNMVPIYGRPSWSSKFLIATINACGRFKPLQYKMVNLGKVGMVEYTEYDAVWETNPTTGKKYKKNTARTATFDGSNLDNIQCIAYTTAKNGEEVMESTPVNIVMAIKEGWYTKSGSKWQTMPIKMLRYRAASFWANEYAPELSMGIYTIEENEDIGTVDGEAEVIQTKMNSAPRTKVGVDAGPAPSAGQPSNTAPTPTAPPTSQPTPPTSAPTSDDEPGY